MRAQFIAGAVALLLVSCAKLFPAPQSPAQAVYESKAAFLVALHAAGGYAALPRCPAQPLCADANIVADIKSSATAAQASLDAAQSVVTGPAFRNGDTRAKAVAAAIGAVAAFAAITAALPTEQTP